MSNKFYIEKPETRLDNGNVIPSEFYSLTCTTDVDLTFSGRPTMSPVESGANVSDHYQKENIRLSYTGVITDVANLFIDPSQRRTSKENLDKLKALWDSGQGFTVYYDGDSGYLKSCVFSNLQFTKSSGMGEAWNVSMAIEQIQTSKRASLVNIPDQTKAVANQHSGKKNTGDNNTKEKPIAGILSYLSSEANPSFLSLVGDALSSTTTEDLQAGQ